MKKMTVLLILIVITSMTALASVYAEKEAAFVFSLNGKVSIVPKGSITSVECRKNMVLYAGDWVKTGSDSSATIAFDKEASNVITIEENSLVIIKFDGYFKVQLMRGEIYAILENVERDETFRVLAPSVVTESLSSGWGASTDGEYTNVVVFDNRVLVCGVNKDGETSKKKYWIEEGYQRKTLKFQDPGQLEPVPDTALHWFKEQVVAHHLFRKAEEEENARTLEGTDTSALKKSVGDAKEENVDLLEYLLKQRLEQRKQ